MHHKMLGLRLWKYFNNSLALLGSVLCAVCCALCVLKYLSGGEFRTVAYTLIGVLIILSLNREISCSNGILTLMLNAMGTCVRCSFSVCAVLVSVAIWYDMSENFSTKNTCERTVGSSYVSYAHGEMHKHTATHTLDEILQRSWTIINFPEKPNKKITVHASSERHGTDCNAIHRRHKEQFNRCVNWNEFHCSLGLYGRGFVAFRQLCDCTTIHANRFPSCVEERAFDELCPILPRRRHYQT